MSDFLLCEECVGNVPWVIDLRTPAPSPKARPEDIHARAGAPLSAR
jgi:hypothetical protein